MQLSDKIIIGAGMYGLYAALFCARKGESVTVLEYDNQPFSRPSYINQARSHNGYHYPRSYSTALQTIKYYDRFNREFHFAIDKSIKKIYATASKFSWTSSEQFNHFCSAAEIKCDSINPERYFKPDLCDGAFSTEECTFDAMKIKRYFIDELAKFKNVNIRYSARIVDISLSEGRDAYFVELESGEKLISHYLLNSSYASINQIIHYLGFDKFPIKYEICEVILCRVSDNIKNIGITVMDGPFFSLMPFGNTEFHSLTAVAYTPHRVSYDSLPTFSCQHNVACSPRQLENCNLCDNKPNSAWDCMYTLARKFLQDEIEIDYQRSLFAMKGILLSSEANDSRPTIIKTFSHNPTFISVLSGKINTIYDLEEVL